MGPIERELREVAGCQYPLQLTAAARNAFESAHETLSLSHCGHYAGVYTGCCAEAFSEVIEAAEALGL